jgi:hypothetical protein
MARLVEIGFRARYPKDPDASGNPTRGPGRHAAGLRKDVETTLSIHRIPLTDRETTDHEETVEKIRGGATGLFAHLVATTTDKMGLGGQVLRDLIDPGGRHRFPRSQRIP